MVGRRWGVRGTRGCERSRWKARKNPPPSRSSFATLLLPRCSTQSRSATLPSFALALSSPSARASTRPAVGPLPARPPVRAPSPSLDTRVRGLTRAPRARVHETASEDCASSATLFMAALGVKAKTHSFSAASAYYSKVINMQNVRMGFIEKQTQGSVFRGGNFTLGGKGGVRLSNLGG